MRSLQVPALEGAARDLPLLLPRMMEASRLTEGAPHYHPGSGGGGGGGGAAEHGGSALAHRNALGCLRVLVSALGRELWRVAVGSRSCGSCGGSRLSELCCR